jgi:uncharacterized membrane protein YedE/YeeE
MEGFTPGTALVGGALIGLAASGLLLLVGRIAGISGIIGGLFQRDEDDRGWRLAFVTGLFVGGAIMGRLLPEAFAITIVQPVGLLLAAGFLVGVGTQLGSGCTSGHGVCGLSRGSVRSLVATVTFMATGIATVFVVRHVLGWMP